MQGWGPLFWIDSQQALQKVHKLIGPRDQLGMSMGRPEFGNRSFPETACSVQCSAHKTLKYSRKSSHPNTCTCNYWWLSKSYHEYLIPLWVSNGKVCWGEGCCCFPMRHERRRWVNLQPPRWTIKSLLLQEVFISWCLSLTEQKVWKKKNTLSNDGKKEGA